jgi:hypothetical protein
MQVDSYKKYLFYRQSSRNLAKYLRKSSVANTLADLFTSTVQNIVFVLNFCSEQSLVQSNGSTVFPLHS